MPSRKIINAVTETVRTLNGWPALRVLDLSCGDGRVLEALAAGGCRVEGTHFRADDYIYQQPASILKDATIHEGVDLTRPLPFPDATYDVVIATEVMEHLPSHVVVCAEVGRILKPGGFFILTTPNIHRLASRLKFLLSGQHELRSARVGWHTQPGDLYSTHFNPLYFPAIHTMLHHNGLHVQRLLWTTCKPWTVMLAVLYPAVWLATMIETRHAVKRSRDGGRDLLRWMLDPRMQWSDQLGVLARKADD